MWLSPGEKKREKWKTINYILMFSFLSWEKDEEKASELFLQQNEKFNKCRNWNLLLADAVWWTIVTKNDPSCRTKIRELLFVLLHEKAMRNLILFSCVDKRYNCIRGIWEVLALFNTTAVSFSFAWFSWHDDTNKFLITLIFSITNLKHSRSCLKSKEETMLKIKIISF